MKSPRRRTPLLPHEFRIGVYAPYDWSGITHLAVAAADTIHTFGFPVSYYPAEVPAITPKTGLYPRWDGRVLSKRRVDFADWARPITHILWFAFSPPSLEVAINSGKRNIIIAVPERLFPESPRSLLGECDYVVCPSPKLLTPTRSIIPGVPAVAGEWDAGLPLRDRALRRVEDGHVRLLVFLDADGTRLWGDDALTVVLALLAANRFLRVTFACCGSDKRLRARLEMASKALPDDLAVIDRPSAWDRFRLAPLHDWIWLLAGDSGAGSFAMEYLSAGRLVLGFDISPINEVVKHGIHGGLIPCARTSHVSRLVPCWESILEHTEELVCGPDTFVQSLKYPWGDVERRKRHFQEMWRNVLLAV